MGVDSASDLFPAESLIPARGPSPGSAKRIAGSDGAVGSLLFVNVVLGRDWCGLPAYGRSL